MKDSNIRKIIDRCLETDAGLRTLQKALVFDEDDVDSFCNTYHYIIERLIIANWEIHELANEISIQDFRRLLEDNE